MKRDRGHKWSNIRTTTGDSNFNFTGREGITKEYHEQLYTNTLANLDEMHKFPETHKLPKLTQ